MPRNYPEITSGRGCYNIYPEITSGRTAVEKNPDKINLCLQRCCEDTSDCAPKTGNFLAPLLI